MKMNAPQTFRNLEVGFYTKRKSKLLIYFIFFQILQNYKSTNKLIINNWLQNYYLLQNGLGPLHV